MLAMSRVLARNCRAARISALNAKRQSSHAPNEIVALDHLLHEMRLFKSRAELAVMNKAARIAVAAHRRAMRVCKPGMREYELEAEFLHEFRRHGAECSYLPIVAAGANACILHYRANGAVLKDGELVLIDAGCEFEMYASDITRSFPVSGRRRRVCVTKPRSQSSMSSTRGRRPRAISPTPRLASSGLLA